MCATNCRVAVQKGLLLVLAGLQMVLLAACEEQSSTTPNTLKIEYIQDPDVAELVDMYWKDVHSETIVEVPEEIASDDRITYELAVANDAFAEQILEFIRSKQLHHWCKKQAEYLADCYKKRAKLQYEIVRGDLDESQRKELFSDIFRLDRAIGDRILLLEIGLGRTPTDASMEWLGVYFEIE